MPPWPASRNTVRWRSPEVGANSTHDPGSKYLASMARPGPRRGAAAVRAGETAARDAGATSATAVAAVASTVARATRFLLLSGRTVGLLTSTRAAFAYAATLWSAAPHVVAPRARWTRVQAAVFRLRRGPRRRR